MAKKKLQKKVKRLNWLFMEVNIDRIRPTPNNYKIATELGLSMMIHSLNKYGRAGAVVVNPVDYKKLKTCNLDLIDGNSRWKEAKERGDKTIWITYPERQLSPKDYKEMAAMFDYAKAGQVDTDRINSELGTSKQFRDEWGLKVPMKLLNSIGTGARPEEFDHNSPQEQPKSKKAKEAEAPQSDIMMISLFFSAKQEKEFRAMEEKLQKKFKTNNTTDTVFKAFKSIK